MVGMVNSCESCSLRYLDPMPGEEELYAYNKTYWNKWPSNPMFKFQAKSRAEFIRRYVSPHKVLDVGSGRQSMFDYFPGKYSCVEPDISIWGTIKCHGVGYSIQDFNAEKFDLVIMSHVLEHIPNPLEYLKKVRKFGGHLFIEVPNGDDEFKANTYPHVLFFNEKSLWIMLQKAGFKVLSIATCGIVKRKWMEMENRPKLMKKIGSFYDSYESNRYGGDRIWLRALAQ